MKNVKLQAIMNETKSQNTEGKGRAGFLFIILISKNGKIKKAAHKATSEIM